MFPFIFWWKFNKWNVGFKPCNFFVNIGVFIMSYIDFMKINENTYFPNRNKIHNAHLLYRRHTCWNFMTFSIQPLRSIFKSRSIFKNGLKRLFLIKNQTGGHDPALRNRVLAPTKKQISHWNYTQIFFLFVPRYTFTMFCLIYLVHLE